MQYAVPQFTDVEDKLIGPFTLKQFLTLLGAGGVDLFFWSIFKLSLIFFILALPTTLLGLGLTFGKLNGRPLFTYVGSIVSFFSKPQSRIFKREEPTVIMKVEKKTAVKAADPNAIIESPESRLKKLAYLLDQKTEEEKEIITRQSN